MRLPPAIPSQYPTPLSGVRPLSSRLSQPCHRTTTTALPNSRGTSFLRKCTRYCENSTLVRGRLGATAAVRRSPAWSCRCATKRPTGNSATVVSVIPPPIHDQASNQQLPIPKPLSRAVMIRPRGASVWLKTGRFEAHCGCAFFGTLLLAECCDGRIPPASQSLDSTTRNLNLKAKLDDDCAVVGSQRPDTYRCLLPM